MSGLLKSAKSVNQALFPQFESLKQGRLSKLVNIYRDYRQALVDVFKYGKEKPFRLSIQATAIGLITFATVKNPDEDSYKELLLDASNRHSLISDLIRNKQSINSVKILMKQFSEERLKYVNLGVCSLILQQPHSPYYDSYDKHCKETRTRWIHVKDWTQNIVDVGFLNHWYFLNEIMTDFDVNDDEFS